MPAPACACSVYRSTRVRTRRTPAHGGTHMDTRSHPYRRILVPLDGSSLAERALPFACRLADQHRAELVLVRCVEPGPVSGAAAFARSETITSAQHSAIGAAQLY